MKYLEQEVQLGDWVTRLCPTCQTASFGSSYVDSDGAQKVICNTCGTEFFTDALLKPENPTFSGLVEDLSDTTPSILKRFGFHPLAIRDKGTPFETRIYKHGIHTIHTQDRSNEWHHYKGGKRIASGNFAQELVAHLQSRHHQEDFKMKNLASQFIEAYDTMFENTSKKFSKDHVISSFEKANIGDTDFHDTLEKHLRHLDSTERLGGKFDHRDIRVAANRSADELGIGTSTYTNGVGQNYDSTSPLYHRIHSHINKHFIENYDRYMESILPEVHHTNDAIDYLTKKGWKYQNKKWTHMNHPGHSLHLHYHDIEHRFDDKVRHLPYYELGHYLYTNNLGSSYKND